MTRDPNDVVRVAAGELVRIEMYQQALTDAGIESKVVGLNLEASFGTALSGSIELWVHRSDAAAAEAAIRRLEEHRGHPESEGPTHPHPTDDPHKPRAGGHGPHTHVDQDPRS